MARSRKKVVIREIMGFGKTALCPKCMKVKRLTKHHCLPKRFFGNNNNILYICRDCHDLIEEIIPEKRQLTRKEYIEITRQWLRDEPIVVKDEEVTYAKGNNFQSIQDAFKHVQGMLDSVLISSNVRNR